MESYQSRQSRTLGTPRAFLAGLAVLAVVLAGRLALASLAVSQAAEPKSGTTSRAARMDALRLIPFDKLDADARAKASAVTKANSLFRRLPVETIDCDPKLYLYLVRNPEVVVGIWQLMGVTDMSLQRTGPESFRIKDEAGTTGKIEFLYGDQQMHILYVEGQYRGPLYPRTITANGLMVLHSRYAHDANGRTMVTNQLDTFIEVQNVGADLVAKTFQNVFGHTTDHNFSETAGFVSKLSRAVEDNPTGVQRMAAKLTSLDPQARARFAQVAAQVAHPASGEDDQPAGATTASPTRGSSMRR